MQTVPPGPTSRVRAARGHGGVAVLVRDHFSCDELPTPTTGIKNPNLEILWMLIRTGKHPPLLVASAYRVQANTVSQLTIDHEDFECQLQHMSVAGVLSDARKFGLTYVMTAHLNQDLVDNFFSQIRAICGANCNPTAVKAQTRMRRMLLVAAQALTATSTADGTCVGLVTLPNFGSRMFMNMQVILCRGQNRSDSWHLANWGPRRDCGL